MEILGRNNHSYGTMEQKREPSYDIEVGGEEIVLYKHIPESEIVCRIVGNEDYMVLYKIHWNLQYIFNYLACNIDKIRYRNQDKENGLFVLEDSKKELFRKRILQWLLKHFPF